MPPERAVLPGDHPTVSSSAAPAGESTARFASQIAAWTLVSRVLGLVRDMLTAALLGAGPVMDAFVLAFTVPNLFRRLFGEGALSTAFIPVFAERDASPERDGRRLLSVAFTWLLVLLGGLAAVLCAVSTGLAVAERPLSLAPKASLFFSLLALMASYLPLICLAALVAGALQVRNRFLVPAASPALLNLFWIGGLLLLVPRLEIGGLALAVTLGGAAQLTWHLAAARRQRLMPRLDFRFDDPDLRRVRRLLAPVVLGLAAMQLNVMMDRVIAEFCVPGDGANAALYYGNRLMQLPLGVFMLAIATAAFPDFARCTARDDMRALLHRVRQALRLTNFISLPCIAVTLALAGPIVALLFGRGAFAQGADGRDAVSRTASVLVFYTLGLWAYGAVHVLSRAFYSLKDTRTPVRIALVMTGANLALNLVLVWPLREGGLALATAISSAGNATWLAWRLDRRLGGLRRREVLSSGAKCLVASALAGAACWAALAAMPEGARTLLKLVRVGIPASAGLAMYFAAAFLLRMSEPRELLKALSRRGGR